MKSKPDTGEDSVLDVCKPITLGTGDQDFGGLPWTRYNVRKILIAPPVPFPVGKPPGPKKKKQNLSESATEFCRRRVNRCRTRVCACRFCIVWAMYTPDMHGGVGVGGGGHVTGIASPARWFFGVVAGGGAAVKWRVRGGVSAVHVENISR